MIQRYIPCFSIYSMILESEDGLKNYSIICATLKHTCPFFINGIKCKQNLTREIAVSQNNQFLNKL